MYYQNGNYMQDLNFYNQNPTMQYNPYGNPSYPNMNAQMQMGTLSAMYPAIYRIISPVVSQILTNHQGGYMTEDTLTSMVDSVYNIVEGDIHLEHQDTPSAASEAEDRGGYKAAGTAASSHANPASTTVNRENRQNPLLRDLIKIMILNELMRRRGQNMNQQMMQNGMAGGNMNPNMFV